MSLYLFALASMEEWSSPDSASWLRVTAVGPVLMFCLFYFVSIPLMEKRSMARRKGYPDYVKKTASLVPFLF